MQLKKLRTLNGEQRTLKTGQYTLTSKHETELNAISSTLKMTFKMSICS